jgi:hypothetical protein
MSICAQWNRMAAAAYAAIALVLVPVGTAFALAVPPVALPGPYAVECSNVAQDTSRLAPGESIELYWEGVARANGTARRPADVLANPANTPMVTVDAPDDRELLGSFAGRSLPYVLVICHPTSPSNPRADYTLPTGDVVPHMLRNGDQPLWPDATTRFPILLLSHGYGEAPIQRNYLLALTVFASYGYVVVAPFHTDAAISDLRNLEGFLDFLYLVTHFEQFIAMQALRPLELSKALDYVLTQPQWRDRVDAARVGGFGASMGGESMLLLGGAELTTTPLFASKAVTFDPRLKAAVGYVPYFGHIGFSAFGRSNKGLDEVTLPYLAIAGTLDTTAPLTETLSGIHQLAGPRELVTLSGVEHKLDAPSIPDIFTWALAFFDSEVHSDPAGRAKLLGMTSVMGGGDDHVLVPYNGPPTVTPAPVNYQGMWWNPSESGWGIDFTHQGELIFAAWFTHDESGKSWYLSMTATQTGPNTFTGPLLRSTGPALDAPFDPNQVQRIPVGTGTLSFSDANNGIFSYTVDGFSQTKSITRLVFGPVPTCTWGSLADLTLATNYTDMWWNAAESGWGLDFTHQGERIFAGWFTYDFTGAAMQLSTTLNKVSSTTYSGQLIKTSGPPFHAVPFDPGAVMRAEVGTATVTFANGNAGTFTFTVNDGGKTTTQTKSITRFVFRAPGTACR